MVLRLLGTVVLLSSLSAFASDVDCPQEDAPSVADQLAQHVTGCPNDEGLDALCSFVSSKSPDTVSDEKYFFQRIMKRGACVSPTDTKEQEAIKIRQYWKKYEDRMICNNASFSVENGSIVKYAIIRASDQFIYDVTKKWRVNLNNIDPSDNKTILDFAEGRLALEKSINSSLVPKIEMYIKFLKESGAKRRNEL